MLPVCCNLLLMLPRASQLSALASPNGAVARTLLQHVAILQPVLTASSYLDMGCIAQPR